MIDRSESASRRGTYNSTAMVFDRVGRSLNRVVVVTVVLALVSPIIASGAFAPASAAETIVGRWVENSAARGTCMPLESLVIRPMSIGVGEDFACDFTDVMRSGDIVTWHGACTNFGEADSTKATVVASLAHKLLTVTLNGRRLQVYRRCESR